MPANPTLPRIPPYWREILSDTIYSLNVATSRTVPVNDNSRIVASAMLDGAMFRRYTGLAHLSGGLQAELQYRGSADFDAVTFNAFARGWLDNYQSSLRDGERYSFGVGARRALTDRIEAYGELSVNGRTNAPPLRGAWRAAAATSSH